MVRIDILLIKLSFDLRSCSILPYGGSGNIFESAGQKDLQRLWSLSNGEVKFRWLHFLGLSNYTMLDPVCVDCHWVTAYTRMTIAKQKIAKGISTSSNRFPNLLKCMVFVSQNICKLIRQVTR